MICKHCLRPYVNPFTFTISFSFGDNAPLEWEGCADCAYHMKRQLVDFVITAAKPTKKALSKQKYIARMDGTF